MPLSLLLNLMKRFRNLDVQNIVAASVLRLHMVHYKFEND